MKKIAAVAYVLALLVFIAGYTVFKKKKEPLDPNKPINITLWHYYNGHTKDKFDELVKQFNETIGIERGIVIDAQSQSDVEQLAKAVYNAANKTIGSQPMPDIFAAYPESAYRVNQVTELVALENYFSEKELSNFRKEFLDEGRFGADKKLKILPVAKSTENLYLNKTSWDAFAEATGANLEDLNTWEGIVKTSEKYKEYNGKAFFSIDANANYMFLAAMQLGEELYTYEGDVVKLNFNENTAQKIWENYYVPYVKGYFQKTGRFSSDDAKTGGVAAYTGSSAGAAYFPKEVALSPKVVYPIDAIVLPYPYFKEGKPYAFQQGAGMCISKSDLAHEYGAALFLKWFTDIEQNVDFAVSTSYFPVKNEALNENIILSALDKQQVTKDVIRQSVKTTMKMFDSYTLYGNKPFKGSYEMRALLETNLFNRAQKDSQVLKKRVAAGENPSKVVESLTSKEQFNEWYQQFKQELSYILSN